MIIVKYNVSVHACSVCSCLNLIDTFQMTDEFPRLSPEIIRNEHHQFYADGGYSRIIINAKVGHTNNFTCEVALIDKEMCSGESLLQFQGECDYSNKNSYMCVMR